ncbi:hypothetical protein CAPTEDRAFT_198267 [Capitella teleta]|uniref:Uncharacterized protein n=1 Tax=Capitella teleta TaxID=283909 RepID=R7TGP0_CAPTE|nr:hypothetical protein CAPTEDRAFT_198267 [Capitella teleta]|eukprot:ELT90746.1 hypothetical protein CAPTEDRAFT_198267 [Capitella teleta]
MARPMMSKYSRSSAAGDGSLPELCFQTPEELLVQCIGVFQKPLSDQAEIVEHFPSQIVFNGRSAFFSRMLNVTVRSSHWEFRDTMYKALYPDSRTLSLADSLQRKISFLQKIQHSVSADTSWPIVHLVPALPNLAFTA